MLLFVSILCLKVFLMLVIVAFCMEIFLTLKRRSRIALLGRLDTIRERAEKLLEIAERQVAAKKRERSRERARDCRSRRKLALAFCVGFALAVVLFVPPKLRGSHSTFPFASRGSCCRH